MAAEWIEKLTGSFEDKKRYRNYRARVEALPTAYGDSVKALERYLTYAGAISAGDTLVQMLDDLAVLFEEAAANSTPLRDVTGENPAEFAEDFLANYSDGQWINKERMRLNSAIAKAAGEAGSS
ncbi:DUF1048 domain-containing protein [Galactobacter caseinivorans]|uniref:DUF1048 domain-containing protein n=1 Tax=Galactobacter caseinivorans TaxID=2676123 RepID=A0A496PIT1_9MICC|nr:DUF1048 domain-containing protein [Galactobacter caseinivorans]RKW70389.1 DUF1048 domain-containing protein [Galactobacter caseinivorans]